QVQEETYHCQHIENGDWPAAKGRNHIGLDRTRDECVRSSWSYAHRQVQKVENNKKQEHNASDQHGAGCERLQTAHQLGATELTAGVTGAAVQDKRAVDVRNQRDNQYDADDPQQRAIRKNWLAHGAQEFTVLIQRFFPTVSWSVELQVAGHVANNVQRKNKAGYGHG